ncbi:MAG: ABC transporter permease [Nocardioides sp.]|uniref:ABC transporter permease n=1 Tax=Nocardioides sp. TaxID=35761 RepID=UPI0039E48BDE
MSSSMPGVAMTPPLPPVTNAVPTPFSRTFKVEFRKAWDSRAGFWLLATIVALVVLVELIATIVTGVKDEEMAWGDFAGIAGFVTSVLLPVLGIMLVTSEWGQRTAMTTFTLEPRRPRVILAKALVGVALTVITVVAAMIVGLVCNGLYAVLAGHGDWDPGLGNLAGFTIYQVLSMLGGFAFACLFLNTAAAIVAFFAYTYVVPTLLAIGSATMDWFDKLAPWIDFQSAVSHFVDWSFEGDDVAQLIVSGLIWLGIPLFFGLRRILRAEVK